MLHYENLIGLEFQHGKQDCYELIRRFYADNYNIDLPNYARPSDWWKADGLMMYADRYFKNGFRPLDVHPSEWQPGDIFLMAIKSLVGNHAGVLVERGQILHHVFGRRSVVEAYRGIWRNGTLGVFRHKDVTYTPGTSTTDIGALIKQRMENARPV